MVKTNLQDGQDVQDKPHAAIKLLLSGGFKTQVQKGQRSAS
jgi:hypothetical protein